MSFKDNPEQLCPECTKIDLDDAFDHSYFDELPPYDSGEAKPWSTYIRFIHHYTIKRVAENGHFCSLCNLLRQVAIRLKTYYVPRGITSPWSAATPTSIEDGPGFTLYAVPSTVVYKPFVADPKAKTAARPPAVFLVVISGQKTLERVAQEYPGPSRTDSEVISQAMHFAKDHGSLISLAGDPDGDASAKNPSMRQSVIRPGRLNYGQIRSWITSCVNTHPECSNTEGYVPGMKVIDCETRKIVKPRPDLRYAALSYVWGKGTPEKYDYPSLPVELPAIIDDSLTVCKKLGIPYLWVDRYCIWQDDPVHKMGQIVRMDEIYGNALVTIVGAAGNSSSYPLPGVGIPRVQSPQIVERVGGKTLVCDYSYNRQRMYLERSMWFTRGWTFQEWTLSPRVLVFTEYRVSFQCTQVECLEHLSCPVLIHEGSRNSSNQRDLITPDGIRSLVQSYSNRELSFQTDALNAITGIMKAWCRMNPEGGYIAGVFVILPKPDERNDVNMFVALWDGLMWSLALSDSQKGTRRYGFPTWSWVSIQGKLQTWATNFLLPSGAKETKKAILDGGAKLETDDGQITDWPEFVNSGNLASKGDKVVAIHIEGWSFKVGPFTRCMVGRRNLFCLRVSHENHARLVKFHPDLGNAVPESFFREEYDAICPFGLVEGRSALVFERTAEGARRIGVLQLEMFSIDESVQNTSPEGLLDLATTFTDIKRDSVRLI